MTSAETSTSDLHSADAPAPDGFAGRLRARMRPMLDRLHRADAEADDEDFYRSMGVITTGADGGRGGLFGASSMRTVAVGLAAAPVVALLLLIGGMAIFGAPTDALNAEDPGVAIADGGLDAPYRDNAPALSQPQSPSVAGDRAIAPTLARETRPAAATTSFATKSILTPAGATIGAMGLDGDRLALQVTTPRGEAILIYNYARGELVEEIELVAVRNAGDVAAREDGSISDMTLDALPAPALKSTTR